MGNDLQAQKLYEEHLHEIRLKRERAGLLNCDMNFVEKNVESIENYNAEQQRKQMVRAYKDL
jgi:hypothetical protein